VDRISFMTRRMTKRELAYQRVLSKNGIKSSIPMRFFLHQNPFNGHNPAFNIKGGQRASKLGTFSASAVPSLSSEHDDFFQF
jgi:hypothetical protein